MIEKGYIKIIGGEYPILSLTPQGENAIKQKETIALKIPEIFETGKVKHAKAKLEAGGTVEYTARLFNEGLTPEQIAQPAWSYFDQQFMVTGSKLIEARKNQHR